jgi:hypothetical protein
VARHIVLAAILCAVNVPAWAQTIPDLNADPVGWLKGSLGGAACVAYEAGPSAQRMERITENTEVQFDGCTMVLQQAAAYGPHTEVRTFAVPLATLDAASITLRPWSDLPAGWTSAGDVPADVISLTVPDGQPLIESRFETFAGLPPTTTRTRSMDILVLHKDTAPQIVQALRLAVEACRRASATPTTK